MEGQFRTIKRCFVPPVENPARGVIWHDRILRPEGLYPSHQPDVEVYCPSYRLRDCWVIRRLTIAEKLRLYQMPLSMDDVLSTCFPSGRLPFADSPSPEVYTSLFRQLWGDDGVSGVRRQQRKLLYLLSLSLSLCGHYSPSFSPLLQ